MSDFLPYIIIGVTTGSVYGLAGTGLVLTYKTSGIFNFAYGSIAALSVFVFYWLHDEHGLAWPLAALLVLGVMSPAEGLLLELMARILDPMTAKLKVVATIGLLLIVLGIGTLWFGNNLSNFPQFLPMSTIRVDGVYIAWNQIIVVIISVVATAVLYWFFRFVRMGIAMRGVVDNADLLAFTGESPIRVRRWAWVIGTVFASAAGLLLAPNLGLDALTITMLVVQAFGAAAIGYFSNLPLTFAGGLLIGVAGSLATKYAASVTWLTGLPAGLPFIVLFVVLIVTPRARLVERRMLKAVAVRRSWYAPVRVRLATGAAVLIALGFVPQLVGVDLSIWSQFLIGVMLFLSLGLLVRTSGQISLCHLAFAAVGAAAFAHFVDDWHVPWLLAVLLAGLVAVPVGAIIAIPAIRLSGVFLALATFGFGILLEQMVYTTNIMFGPTTAGFPAPRPDVSLGAWHMATDTGFYYVLLVFTVVATAAVLAIQRGRMGRLLNGLADSPLALEIHGATTNVTRVLIFCISAAMAGVAGALTSVLFHYSVGSNFSSFDSLLLVAVVVIIVAGDPWYAVLAAFGYIVFPGYVGVNNINTYLEIVFGVSATTYAIMEGATPAVPRSVKAILDRVGGRRAGEESPPAAMSAALTPLEVPLQPLAYRATQQDGGRSDGMPADSNGVASLDMQGLTVHFGGVRAVQDVSLVAPTGRISGLVGPNGAGKTTIFNACCGLIKPTAGRVFWQGSDVTKLGPAERSRRGVGRTFQRPELCNSLSVRDNVALGREASMAGRHPIHQLAARRGERANVESAVEAAMSLTGINHIADLQTGLLPTGLRRLVELARALAGPFDMLLLDEPSSGLDATESKRFGEILSRVVSERGTGMLLVEHDMALVRQVCELVYVIDFGVLIFEGTPEEMVSSDTVRTAYLGSGDLTTGLPPDSSAAVETPSLLGSPSGENRAKSP